MKEDLGRVKIYLMLIYILILGLIPMKGSNSMAHQS